MKWEAAPGLPGDVLSNEDLGFSVKNSLLVNWRLVSEMKVDLCLRWLQISAVS